MYKLTKIAALSAAIFSLSMASVAANATPLQDIKDDGVIRIGVKTDYKPFSYMNKEGNIIGFEPDLAQLIADDLGVKLEFIPVQTANRMQFLQQGRIDVMIATMSVNEERLRAVHGVEPYYFGTGTGLIMSKKDAENVSKWEDLKDYTVCGTQGAYYNRNVKKKYNIDVRAFPSTTEAQAALKTGTCQAFVQDNILIDLMVEDPSGEWADYTTPVPVEDWLPWAIAIEKSRADSDLDEYLSETIQTWYKNGTLTDLNKKWGLPENEYLVEMSEKYKD